MISIILPIYNAEKTLAQTLESIKNQTCTDWELIAINDQSTDDSIKIVQTSGIKNLTILNTEDVHKKGIVAALNYGLSKAKGDYIARIDSDDLMVPTRLEEQLAVMIKYAQVNLISTNAEVIDENGQKIANLVSTKDLTQLDERCCIVHPSVMWRKSYFDEQKLMYREEYEFCEDYDLWLRFRSSPVPAYAQIDKPLLLYRASKNSISSTKQSIIKERIKNLYKEFKVTPYLSIINLDKTKSQEAFQKEMEQQSYNNYEIIDDLSKAKGKLIAFSKFENIHKRFDSQVMFLETYKNFVGCGTFIQKDQGSFFYTQDSKIIERELLTGHMIIEPATFMCINNKEAYSNIDTKNPDMFKLYCNLMKFGQLTNIPQPLVKNNMYESIPHSNLNEKKKYAKEVYKDIINTVQLNITSEGNFSGVDRYLKTLEDNSPSNVKVTRITFITSDHNEWKVNQSHSLIYYNPSVTKLESMFEMFWDNFQQLFIDVENLIVQSNCLNLYSLICFLRTKTKLTHICAMHCVPYREVIRYDRNKYAELEELFNDDSKDFTDTIEHRLPLQLADHVILNTKDAEQYYLRCGYNTPYTVISNGIEQIGGGVRDYDGKRPFRFIFVGHASPLKGFDQLLPIIDQLKSEHNFEVLWVGSPSEQLKQVIASKRLPVKVLGIIHPEQLNELYKQVDAALIATACETCSYAAIESLSAELPIVATRAHGVTEIVENVGLLVDIDKKGVIDAEMYKDAMIKIMTDEKLRATMSQRAKERAKEFNKEKMIFLIIDLFKRLIK